MRRAVPALIPEHWTHRPAWSVLRQRRAVNQPDLPLLSVYRDYGVIPKDSRDDNYNKPSLDLTNYQVVGAGNVVANKMKTWQGSIGVSELHGIVSPAYLVFEADNTLDSRYLHYLLRSRPYVAEYGRVSYGVRPAQWDLRWEDMRDIRIVQPPLDEQRLIAAFLDRETHRIDALVDGKRRMINLLEEKLTSSITRLVTKGTDPSAPIAPSGIDWIGGVPSHWSIQPVGARFRLQLGKMLNRAAAEGPNQLPYLRNVNVQWWDVNLSDVATMSFDEAERVKFRLKPGDLLVCEGGEVGRAAIWKGEFDECLFQKAIHRLRPRYDDDPRFLAFVLYAASSMEVFRMEGNQSTIVHLTGEQLRAHRIAFPPPAEQQRIVASLNRTRQKITTATSCLESQLDLLTEYRQALITQAVTGQLDEATLKGDKRVDEAVGVIPE